MHLTLGSTGADRSPAHEIREELSERRVEELGAGRQAKIGKIGEELTREAQPFVDAVRTVQIRVVDQALPAYDGPWLFEVHPHDDENSVVDIVRQLSQALRVVDGSLRVVDRAGTNDGEKARVAAVENRFNRTSRTCDTFATARRDRNLLGKDRRGQERADAADPQVIGLHMDARGFDFGKRTVALH